jgi:Shikimate kinase
MLKFKKNTVKNICFVGFMGSGKSILGRDLSKLYNIEFFDSDLEIENKIGKSINQIFADSGENYFRKIEEKVCIDLLKDENCIISLGGGSIINSKIRKI